MSDAIMVTGGAGFIGAHAAKALARAGFRPVVYDNLSRGHADAVRWGPLEVGDLADADALDAAFARHRPVAVMHFAALAYVGESVAEPLLYHRNNVGGSIALLEAMRRAGCDAIVFSSTCATYGACPPGPIGEETPQAPINPYGASKLMVERILRDVETAHGIRHAALRYFNAAGSDPDGEIGERHDPETHLIPLALDAALGRRRLEVYGDDYDTPDGSCVRDYIHVSDLAEAHVLALRRLLEGGGSRAFNLGVGRGFSIFEVIESVRRVSGRDVPHDVGPRRPGDPPALVADPARARAELGWRPRFVELDEIVAHAWRYRSGRNAPG